MNTQTQQLDRATSELQEAIGTLRCGYNITRQDIHKVAPTTYVVDGCLRVSAEAGDGVADYYGEFRGGYPYIHAELEAVCDAHGFYLEWVNPGELEACKN